MVTSVLKEVHMDLSPPNSQSSIDLNWARPWLRHVCENSLPILSLVQRKDNFYRSKLQHLVEHDLYGNLLSHRSAGRSKRFAAIVIPAIAGLVTLAVESLSGYLQNRRQKPWQRQWTHCNRIRS